MEYCFYDIREVLTNGSILCLGNIYKAVLNNGMDMADRIALKIVKEVYVERVCYASRYTVPIFTLFCIHTT